MTREELKTKFDAACEVLASTYYDTNFDRIRSVYIKMFGEMPNIIGLITEGEYLNPNLNDSNYGNYSKWGTPYAECEDEDDEEQEVLCRTFKNLAVPKTMQAFYDHFKETCYIFRHLNFPFIVGDHFFIHYDGYNNEIFVFQNQPELLEEIKNLVVDEEKDDSVRVVHYITHNNQGFDKTPLQVKKLDYMDLNELYNDDLPHEEIMDFLKGDIYGLLLLHGNPGTGKSFYIRYLMYTLFKKKFMILDNSVFNYITDSSFIQLLINNQNAIIILEDCEEMLVDRVAGNNKLAALLNLSDGIIGDSFNLKFICTFNSNISKLDPAIMRKGRMKLKYEFKKLDKKKVQAFAKKLNKDVPNEDMTLADLFNYGEDNGVKQEKKIGFGN